MKERNGYLCGYCKKTITASEGNLKLHASSAHSESRIKGTTIPKERIKITSTISRILLEDEIKEIEEEIKNNDQQTIPNNPNNFNNLNIFTNDLNNNRDNPRNIERTRPERNDQNRNENQQANQNRNEVTNNQNRNENQQANQNRNEVTNNQNRNENQQANQNRNEINDNLNRNENPEQEDRAQNNVIPNPTNNTEMNQQNDIDQEEINRRKNELLSKCRKWINRNELEELNEIHFPKLTKNLRKKLINSLREIMKNKIIPLIEQCTPKEETEIDWIIFEGSLAKMNLLIRKTIRKTLHIPYEMMIGKNKRKISNTEKEKETIRRQNIIIKNISEITSHIRKIIELKIKTQTQTTLNVISSLEMEIVKILQDTNNETLNKILGGNDIEFIRNIINDNPEHRENRLNYIKATLENIQQDNMNIVSKKYRNITQNMYQEDPVRALRWYILNDPTPECTLNIQNVEDYYKNDFEKIANFVEPKENSLWDIKEMIDDENRDLLLEKLLDKDIIREAIISRSNIAASGPDGIANPIWKADIKSTIKIIKTINNQIIKFGKFPQIMKDSKTILLYKKGDPNEIKSWRPISISNTLYRFIMC